MKTTKITRLALPLALLALVGCKSEEVYDTAVCRNITLTLDGEDWNAYYNTDTGKYLYLFIYDADGSFVANYASIHRFALPEGDYRIFVTNQADYIEPPTSLDDQVIEQDPECKQTFAISDATPYKAGDDIDLALHTRTGLLRLKALDEKADKSYSQVRATVTTPVTAYSVAQGKGITGDESLELVREKETSGGIGYTEDMYLIGSDEYPVSISLEYLDDNGDLVKTKEFADAVTVLPNTTTLVEFNLNNADEAVIVDYTVTLGSIQWGQTTVYPSVQVDVPDGYTYIGLDGDISATLTEQMTDASVDDVKLFLKAGTEYALTSSAMTSWSKSVTIMGQEPGYGQTQATLKFDAGTVTIAGDIDLIRFENLQISAGSRLFNHRNTAFHLGSLEFIDCLFSAWSGVIWYQVANADNQQILDSALMEGCTFMNYTGGSNALWNPAANYSAPIYNFTMRNCTMHGKNLGTKNVILTNLDKMTGDLAVTVEGNTFIDTKGTAFTYFNLNPAAASSCTLTVSGNTLTGAVTGTGTWFSFGTSPTLNVGTNWHTSDYEMSAWGITPTPEATSTTYNDIISGL